MNSRILMKSAVLAVLGVGLLASISYVSGRKTDVSSVSAETLSAKSLSPSSAKQAATTSLTWNFQKVEIPGSSGQLEILLTGLSPSTDYIVGVRSDDAEAPSLVAGEVKFSNPNPKAFRTISEIVDWPQERIKVKPELIEVAGLSRAKGSVLIYLTVAPGTEVNVRTPAKTLAHATPKSGLIIHNGMSLDQEINGIRTLVSRLAKPNPAPNTKQMFTLENGEYVATPKGLASNLVSLRKPLYPVGAASDDLEQVILRVTIDESGAVREIYSVRGNKAFVDSAQQAVSEWKFRPFSVDSKPTTVRASVVFFFGKNGTISSPVFDEMNR